MNSKAVRPCRALSRARLKRASAPLSTPSATKPVAFSAGLETSFKYRNDAKRSLRTDQLVLEVVAAVVLLEGLEAAPDAPIGEQDLKAKHELAGGCIGEHTGTAGIGREVAADLAAGLGRQAQGKVAVDPLGEVSPRSSSYSRPHRRRARARAARGTAGSCRA
jgi:hypothetical protein